MKNGLNSTQNCIMKKEFCELCGISPSTAYKLIKSKKVHFEKCRDGSMQYYSIPMTEVSKYLDEKMNRGKLTEIQIELVRTFYIIKIKDYPDVITSKDVQVITGYSKEIVRKWIKSDKIIGCVSRKKFRIAKEDLIDFLVSPYYAKIIRKSQTHIEDFKTLGII